MKAKKKVLFGITCLKLGGAERVLVDMVNNLCDKYDITIFTLYNNGEFEKELNKKIKLVSMFNKTYDELSTLEKRLLSLKLVNPLARKKIYNYYMRDKYDVEICFLEGPLAWLMSIPSKARKIAWVHNDIRDVFGEGKNAERKKKLSGKCYQSYETLVFVSKDNLEKFKLQYPDAKNKMQVIYNYLDMNLVLEKAKKEEVKDMKDDLVSFVQVSRAVPQKGLFRLIDVHEKLIKDKLLHRIYIIGDGPDLDKLRETVKEKGLEDTFILLGKRSNPYPYIKKGDYFMLTSLYEGFGMVIVEAEILNKYIMITNTAAREAVEDYKENSMIVENTEEGIYKGIKDILKKRPEVNKKDKFNNKKVLEEIIDLIEGE